MTRPRRREDGLPTRIDIRYDTDAERLCRITLGLVESMGASVALTNAVAALDRARNYIADHVEGVAPEDSYPRPALPDVQPQPDTCERHGLSTPHHTDGGVCHGQERCVWNARCPGPSAVPGDNK